LSHTPKTETSVFMVLFGCFWLADIVFLALGWYGTRMVLPEDRRRMVGERLAELREQKALTLRDLEEASGVGADAISKIENGHRKPRPSTLRKLARALGVEVEDFFREPAVPLAETPGEAGSAVVAVGMTYEEATEKLEQQLHAPARIAEGWHRLAQRWEERLERGDFDARSLEDFIDTLEDVALSMQASVAAERRELRARYGEDVARNRAVLRPALDRLSALIGDALRKIDAKELEAEAELAGKLARLEGHLKRAS
jgi:transcriptional regulator with XRE-family HTH domain